MKKYIFVSTGEELPMGSPLVRVDKLKDGSKVATPVIVSKRTIPMLIEQGAIKEVSDEEMPIEFILDHMSQRFGWKADNLGKYLTTLTSLGEAAVFSILLREVAIILDKQYSDHIENSKEIWGISLTDGEIFKFKDLNKIKNFRNFAAFRTVEDAVLAKKSLKVLLVSMFSRKNGKQKDS